MLSLLKMDVLRLVKSRSFYIILGVTAALIVSLVLMVAGISAPEVIDAMAAQGAEIDLEDQQTLEYIKSMDQLAFVHETLGSGFLLVIAGIGMTLFAGGDQKHLLLPAPGAGTTCSPSSCLQASTAACSQLWAFCCHC